MDLRDTTVVAIEPVPQLVAGRLSAEDLAAVATWIDLNRDSLLAYGNGEIDGLEMTHAARRIWR